MSEVVTRVEGIVTADMVTVMLESMVCQWFSLSKDFVTCGIILYLASFLPLNYLAIFISALAKGIILASCIMTNVLYLFATASMAFTTN